MTLCSPEDEILLNTSFINNSTIVTFSRTLPVTTTPRHPPVTTRSPCFIFFLSLEIQPIQRPGLSPIRDAMVTWLTPPPHMSRAGQVLYCSKSCLAHTHTLMSTHITYVNASPNELQRHGLAAAPAFRQGARDWLTSYRDYGLSGFVMFLNWNNCIDELQPSTSCESLGAQTFPV